MRRLAHTALILLLAAVVPTVAISEVCGGMEMPCCSRRSSDAATLARPGCCSAPCFENEQDRREPASETRQIRLDFPQPAAAMLAVDAPAAAPLAEPAADPAVSPPVSRRLASLSTLLI